MASSLNVAPADDRTHARHAVPRLLRLIQHFRPTRTASALPAPGLTGVHRKAARYRLIASPVLLVVFAALVAAGFGGRAADLGHPRLSPAAHTATAHAHRKATPAPAKATPAPTKAAPAPAKAAPAPAKPAAPTCTVPPPPPPPPGLTPEQIGNARVIAQVARDRGLPGRATVIALATAKQESQLIDLNYGDRDSLGLFQQRPSQGWGTPQQLQNPAYAAGKFYDVLVGVPGWQTGRLTDVAQAVQRSGFPDRYQQWEGMATALAASLAPAPCG
jgi:hypothetical protein